MKKYKIKYYWNIHVFVAIITAENKDEAISKFKNGTGGTADILEIEEVKDE